MPTASAEHYAHFRSNRSTIDNTSLLQRRRNLRAAIEVLELLFLGPPPDAPKIPVQEQDPEVVLVFKTRGAATTHTSQEAARTLISDFKQVLGEISDEEAESEEWLKDNMTAAYVSYRKIEGLFGRDRGYNRWVYPSSAPPPAPRPLKPSSSLRPPMTQASHQPDEQSSPV